MGVRRSHPLRALRALTNAVLMEHLKFNLPLRWFVGLGVADRVRDATAVSKNREHLLKGKVIVMHQQEPDGTMTRRH